MMYLLWYLGIDIAQKTVSSRFPTLNKWPKIMLSHVLGDDMVHKIVSKLVPCPGTSLP